MQTPTRTRTGGRSRGRRRARTGTRPGVPTRRARAFQRKVQGLVVQGVVALLVGLALLNGAVRYTGGNPFWLSPWYVREKVHALGALAWHMLRHPFLDCEAGTEPVARAARRHGLPESFLIAVARAETGARPHQISRAGAMGMMQLMPGTARDLGVSDPFDPEQSADGAARYVKRLWRRYRGDRHRVAAAYNAGPGRVPVRGAMKLPKETLVYVRRVLGPQ